MNNEGNEARSSEELGVSQASTEFNKRKRSKPRKRRGGKKVVKKTKKVKVSADRKRKSYEIVSGRPAAKYPKPRKGTSALLIWNTLKAKRRATVSQVADAIAGKIKTKKANLIGHVGWYFFHWKRLGVVRVAKA